MKSAEAMASRGSRSPSVRDRYKRKRALAEATADEGQQAVKTRLVQQGTGNCGPCVEHATPRTREELIRQLVRRSEAGEALELPGGDSGQLPPARERGRQSPILSRKEVLRKKVAGQRTVPVGDQRPSRGNRGAQSTISDAGSRGDAAVGGQSLATSPPAQNVRACGSLSGAEVDVRVSLDDSGYRQSLSHQYGKHVGRDSSSVRSRAPGTVLSDEGASR